MEKIKGQAPDHQVGQAPDLQVGQAIVEYILLLSIVVMLFSGLFKLLAQNDWYERLASPLKKDYAYTYRYGHPKARGVDDGGQKNIAQHPENFRIFVNPTTKK